MLAYLRIADRVTAAVARLAIGPGGLTLGRAGFAPAGRRTKFHGVIASSIPLRPALPGRTVFPMACGVHGDHTCCVSTIFRREAPPGPRTGARLDPATAAAERPRTRGPGGLRECYASPHVAEAGRLHPSFPARLRADGLRRSLAGGAGRSCEFGP